MNRTGALLAAMAASAIFFQGCEDHTIAEAITHSDKSSSSDSSISSLSGTWRGRAGTGQTSTVLRLSQNGSSLSGSWTWGNNDTRQCSGTVSGKSVTLKDTGVRGDTWHLAVSSDGRSMSGTGLKYGGGSYGVSFSR